MMLRCFDGAVVLTLFLPGRLRNFANRGGHWTAKAGYQKRWREKTQAMVRWLGLRDLDPAAPKVVVFHARVWNLFDEHDGLRNALKPVVDGLVRAKVLHSDAPDSGHWFIYGQTIDRTSLGVTIVVRKGGEPAIRSGVVYQSQQGHSNAEAESGEA